jgi:TM2 domain-containing membrane protein YozV
LQERAKVNYFIADGNQRRGPFAQEQLLAQGMRGDTLVWREGMGDWMPASAVAELQSIFGPPPGPASFAQPAPAGYGHPASVGYAQPTAGYPPQATPYLNYGAGYLPGVNKADVNSKKILAGIMALIFGALGVHKFILGMTWTGITMLLITVLTCGFGGIFMQVIGWVEGIVYLTKSDEDFHRIYMVEQRSWF